MGAGLLGWQQHHGLYLELDTGQGLIKDSLAGGALALGLMGVCCSQTALSKTSSALQVLSCFEQGKMRSQDSWPAHNLSRSCFLDGCQGLRKIGVGWRYSLRNKRLSSMHIPVLCQIMNSTNTAPSASCSDAQVQDSDNLTDRCKWHDA